MPPQEGFGKEPEPQELVTDYYRFRHEHRAPYQPQNSQPLSDLGLIYSLPSLMYRDYMFATSQPLCAFEGVARACQEGQVQYDAIIMNHAEIHADHWGLAELKRYPVLVLPAAECLADGQIALLTDYLRQGRTLAVTGDCGAKNEDNLPRQTSPLATWKKAGRVMEIRPGKTYLPPRAAESEATQAQTAETLAALREAVKEPVVRGELPRLLWVKTWTHGAGETKTQPILSAHFVNYNMDFQSRKATAAPPVPVTLALPKALVAEEAQWWVPAQPAQPVAMQRQGDTVTVTIPAVQVYGILVIGPKGAERLAGERLQTEALNARARLAVGSPVKPASDPEGAAALLAQSAEAADQLYLAELEKAVISPNAAKRLAFGAPQNFQGWTAISPELAYSADRGFGWLPLTDDSKPLPDEIYYDCAQKYGKGSVAPEPLAARLPFWPYQQPVPQPLQFSLSSGTSRSFRLDVPEGLYNVRIVTVNPSWTLRCWW